MAQVLLLIPEYSITDNILKNRIEKDTVMEHKAKNHTVKASVQIVSFLVATLALGIIFYKPFVSFYGFDKLPKVIAFPDTPKPDAPVVHVGLLINTFSEFKVESGEFEFAGSIWFQYNPKQIPLEKIKKFHLLHGVIKSISEPDIRTVGDEEVAQFEVVVSFKNNLNYAAFPVDDHYVSIGIFNYALPDGTIIRSELTDFDLGEALSISGWRIMDRQLRIGYVDRVFGKKDLHRTEEVRAFFILKCKRTDPISLITILLSLMIILLVSMIPFSIEEYSGDLISGAIGGIVAFRFVLAAMSPASVGYFMISDYLFIFCLIAVMVTVLGCIMARQFNWRSSYQNVIVIGTYAFFVLGSWLSLYLV